MSTQGQAPAIKPTPWLARQPILTRDEKVLGYELLYREDHEDNGTTSDPDDATCSIIDTLNVIGLDAVCDGRLAFIDCTHQMLLKEFFLLLPPDKVVVEIQATVPADEPVTEACRKLKHANYRIALDNLALNDPRGALVPYADFVKVDIRKSPPEHSAAIVARYASGQCKMLAQKVETEQEQVTSAKGGFTLFQGYFFRHPERMRARHIEASQTSYLRLLRAIATPEVDLDAIENLIKHDASLCYRLLRYPELTPFRRVIASAERSTGNEPARGTRVGSMDTHGHNPGPGTGQMFRPDSIVAGARSILRVDRSEGRPQ